MVKKTLKLSVALPILACSVVLAGCGGGSGGVSMPGDSMDDSKGMTGAGTVTAPVALISGIDRDFTTSRTNLLMDDGMTTGDGIRWRMESHRQRKFRHVHRHRSRSPSAAWA